MDKSDLPKFKAVMRDAREAIGQGEPYTDGALELMFAALRDLTLRDVQKALIAHMEGPKGNWRPNAHYIREAIKARVSMLWMAADEAWARIPQAGEPGTRIRDDGRAVPDYRQAEPMPCLLNQASGAALAAAGAHIAAGDPIAARMTFRATYERLVEQEKAAGRGPEYKLSPGGTEEDRAAVLLEGVRLGMLPPEHGPKPELLGGPTRTGRAALLALKNFAPKTIPKPEEGDYE